MAELQDSLAVRLHKAMKNNAVVQKAIKSALASFERQNSSNVSEAPAMDIVPDTPVQQINRHSGRLSRRHQQILDYAKRPLPRLPREFLPAPTDDLFIPVVEGSDISDVCRCHHNLRCHLHFQGEEYLYVNNENVNRPNQSREMDPLQVLFGFMGNISLPEDVKHIPKDNFIAYVDDLFIREDNESVPFDLDFESVDI